MECDLQSEYGFDVEAGLGLRGRSWRWLATRVMGLLVAPRTRTHRELVRANNSTA